MPERRSRLQESYFALAFLRFALVFIPLTGYIHPDEFFQSIEVFAGQFLEVDVNIPWEFNASFPIRSVALPYFTIGMSIKALRDVNYFAKEFLSISILSPYSLIVFPRLLMCCLSFIADYCLYKICINNNEKGRSRLILLASSYVMIIYGTRTFSNTLELILFAILLYYVSESLTISNILIKGREYLNYRYDKSKNVVERAKFHKLRLFLKSDSVKNCIQISTVTVLGFFNRPTFLAFAVVPIFFWLYRGIGSKSVTSLLFHLRIFTFVLCSIPTFMIVIIIDSFYYGYITWGEIGMFDISIDNFVFTPLNFVKYNINSKNLAQHGIHPRYLHALINVPLLFNILAVCALARIFQYLYRIYMRKFHLLPTIRSIRGLMFLTFLAPVLLLSIFPHQEPRFLIPLIIPLVYLHGTTILPEIEDIVIKASAAAIKNVTTKVKKPSYLLLKLWVLINFVFVIFYGFVHQGGVFHSAQHLSNKMALFPQTEFHVVSSHIYTIPYSLFLQQSTNKIYTSTSSKYVLNKRVFLYEEGSKSLEFTLKKVKTILVSIHKERQLKQGKLYKVYLITPSSLLEKIQNIAIFEDLNMHKERTVYPHLSIEAFPDMSDYCLDIYQIKHCHEYQLLSWYNYIAKLFEFCGLSVIEFSLKTVNS